MNQRIYIQKKTSFDVSSRKHFEDLRIYDIYDIFQLDEAHYDKVLYRVFSDKVTDTVHENFYSTYPYFTIEYLPGQYGQRADSATQYIKIIAPEADAIVRSGRLIELIDLPP
ncbi:hypothetical protein [Bacteroidetes bacterium endosymbiont of Geopemphigus sp.]|uniref:hypothetical protein n=1 Tax=Bacteroidetes bacterium endosymbiont of Geopemphigus sp. TaxID=2047937 RepID=UPI000CD240E7|nr:hypothetical protein [Bacteroidetes bacterium endosymbiont of Geopemphigus sp.]